MSEPLAIVATVFGVVGTAVAVASRLWPASPHPRDTALPPPPPSSSSLRDAELSALAGRVVAIEARLERADLKREDMAASLTRIETLITERTERRGGRRGPTDSA